MRYKFTNGSPFVPVYFIALSIGSMLHGLMNNWFWPMSYFVIGILIVWYIFELNTCAITIDEQSISFYRNIFSLHYKFLIKEVKEIKHNENYLLITLVQGNQIKVNLEKSFGFHRKNIFFLDWSFMTKEELLRNRQEFEEMLKEIGIEYFDEM
jgi:hypothetical protein